MKQPIALVVALVLATTSAAFADDASDTKAQIQALQAQMAAMKAQLDKLQAQQAPQSPAIAPPPAHPPAAGTQDAFLRRKPGDSVTFLLGNSDEVTLYGNLDLSLDYTTKGLQKFYPSSGDSPAGNNSYLAAVSSNISFAGVRGAHKLGAKSNLVYQLETQIDVSSTAGTVNTNSNNDDVVKGALTSRNSFIGIANPGGTYRIGKTDAPYKNSTARMNPFNGELGDYAVIMGNSGGDNRVEFGTRLDHSLWYDTPATNDGVSFSALVSPGQNRSSDSSNIAAGESSCAGGNVAGSGALAPSCNDGSFSSAYSASLAYQHRNLYLTTAYELHKKVNRTSDIGDPVLSPLDIADEQAMKVGMQYSFSRLTSLSAIYEDLKRFVPAPLVYQNERSRDGFWLAMTQTLPNSSSLNFGWARANPSPGDPGQHNTPGGTNPDNMANMYTVAYKHNIDRHVSWYVDWALTVNHPDAHYDLGAGGRGLTTDCHDATQLTAFDPTVAGLVSGTGPHCYAGGRLQGLSTGIKASF